MASKCFGCLFVPDLTLAALLRAEPDLCDLPVAITDGEGGRAAVRECNVPAREAGVTPGMRVAGARALLPALQVRPLMPALVRSAQAALLDVARAFSPRVAWDACGLADRGAVFMDLAGVEGARQLGSKLVARAAQVGLAAQVGIAASLLVAFLASRQGAGVWVVPDGQERSFLAPLPLAWLDAPAPVRAAWLHAALARFGIERVGQLAELPPDGLARRLGPEGVRLWRLARGEEQDSFIAEKQPEQFVEELDVEYELSQVTPLLFGLQGMLARLFTRLDIRGLAAARLLLTLQLAPTGSEVRAIGAAAPSAETRTWLALVRLELERMPPRAPVIGLRVEVEGAARRTSQAELFAPPTPAKAKLDEALARLTTLVAGEGRVGSPRLRDSHRPDDFTLAPFDPPACGLAAVRLETVSERSELTVSYPVRDLAPAQQSVFSGSPPIRALRPPVRVQVWLERARPVFVRGHIQGRVRCSAGPWRVERGWWAEDSVDRDYYEVELAGGEVYRLYQDRQTSNWYVDGICG
jgi:protein ImuB